MARAIVKDYGFLARRHTDRTPALGLRLAIRDTAWLELGWKRVLLDELSLLDHRVRSLPVLFAHSKALLDALVLALNVLFFDLNCCQLFSDILVRLVAEVRLLCLLVHFVLDDVLNPLS